VGNVDAHPAMNLSPFRKVALGTWGDPVDPQIYGTLKLRMEPALAYLDELSRRTGQRVTVTHLVVKAVGAALAACPEANVVLRGGRPYRRQNVDVSVLVALGTAAGQDLSAARIANVDTKSPAQIAQELAGAARGIRAGTDRGLESARRTMQRVPLRLMRWVLRLVTFLSYTLNLDLRRLGIPRDPFGGAVVSSLGSLGLENAFIPLVGYSRAPIVIAAGAITDEPVVDGGRVVPGKVMRLNATFDHRVIDGSHAAVLAAAMRQVIERPWETCGDRPRG
jgi:pyruvate/2-oxoglutarate dehydrogenase complex dihydrolipoamide acyltransferase (E2) component